MTDRQSHPPGFPVAQPNFMNLPQQQQSSMSYQQPPTAMNPAQIPGVQSPENQRLWQQLQDRHRTMGGVDGMGQQQLNPQQMADLLRSQAALSQAQNHQQSQQHPPQLQQAQQFQNLGGMAQMVNAAPAQNPLLAMHRQQGMQGGSMGGVPNAQLQPHMAQLLAQRNGVTNPAMIQMNRQLGLLNRAQKQQPQNGPTNFGQPGPSFGGQQNFPFSQGMFPPKPDEGRLAATQGQQQLPVSSGSANGLPQTQGFTNEVLQRALRNNDGRPLTIDELQFKAQHMRKTLEVERAVLENMSKQTSPETMLAYREKQRDFQTREFLFAKVMEHIRMVGNQQSQQAGPSSAADTSGGSAMSSMGFPNSSQRQQAGQQQVQSPQSWMSQMNNINLPNQPAGALPMNQQMHNGSSQNGPAQTPQQHANSPFHTNVGQTQQQQTPIPRSGPTPQQQILQTFLQQNGSHSSPPSSAPGVLPGQGKFGQQGSALEIQEAQHRPNSLSFPPLARDRFMALLTEWWKRSGISFDPRTMTIGNRHIDVNQLHQLHTEVLQLGGVVNVQRHGLWNVIAAKMGWTQAAINESGHTQDQIAEQIKLVYERLLQSFEQTYMAAAMKQSLTAPPQQQQQQPDHQPAPSQPSSASGQSSNQLSQQQAVQMIKLANMSVEQLRANGYPENLIQNIERSKPQLEATWRRMQMQRIQAATQQQQLPQQQQQLQLQQQGALLNAPLPFHNQLQAQTALQNPPSLPTQGGVLNANGLGHPGHSAGSGPSTEVSGQQRPGLNPSQLTQQNIQMLGMLSNLRRPTPDMIKQASALIEQLKQNVSKERTFRPEHVRHLSDAEKAVFPQQFEYLCNAIREISKFYHIYLAATNDLPIVRGIINMLDMCDKQRQLVQSPNPVYVLDTGTLQRLTKTALEVRAKILAVVQQLRLMTQMEQQNQARAAVAQQGEGGPGNPPPIQQGQSPANIAPSPASIPPRPPTAQPPPQLLPQQNLRPPPAMTPQMAPARPSSVVQGRAKATASTSPNAQDAVPSPSASTPLPNSATPSHLQASPQTPKSPKPKPQPKARPKARRQSKVAQPNANTAPATSAPPSAAPAVVTATTPTPAAEPTPSPAQAAPSPAEPSLKRSREEEPADQTRTGSTVPSDTAAGETPSKRIKTDWENVPDAEPPKRHAEAENIKTTGQAAQFYNDMTQILELSNDSALPPELHETLAQLVKTVGHGLEVPDASGSSSMGLPNAGTSSPKAVDGDDSFFSFLDFTAFQQDDDKVDTPELVPTSSTNPSPESGAGSETDHPPVSTTSGSVGDRTKIVDSSDTEPKTDLFDLGADSLRLGIWGEIDGGESGYFNSSDMWKWDSMPNSSGENSWAIST